MKNIQHSFIHFWHAPLGVHSAKCRHRSLDVNYFTQGEDIGFQVLMDSYIHVVQGRQSGLLEFSKAKLLRSSWHLFHQAFSQCVRTGRNVVLEQ